LTADLALSSADNFSRSLYLDIFWALGGMNTLTLGCTALLVSALMACSAPKVRNAYEGPERAASDVATLFTAKKSAYPDQRPRALFSAVNGKHYGTAVVGYPTVARVLPGEALVKVYCVTDDLPASWDKFLLFYATLRAGHFYELACDRFTASAIDRGTSYESIHHLLADAIQAKQAQ